MQLFKTLLAGAALVASAAASGEGRLRFTSFSQSVAVGDPVALTWTGGVEGVCYCDLSSFVCLYTMTLTLDSPACLN